MRWYERLYVGEKAKKFRYSVIQAVRERRPLGYYVLTPAVNEKNLLELYPAVDLFSALLPGSGFIDRRGRP